MVFGDKPDSLAICCTFAPLSLSASRFAVSMEVSVTSFANQGKHYLDNFVMSSCEHRGMTNASPRLILAANLKRLMARDSPPGERVSVRGWATSKGLDVRMIDRLVKADNAVTLDKLGLIADACGLQAWQLLIEDLDPDAPPAMPITAEERAMLAKLRRLLGPA